MDEKEIEFLHFFSLDLVDLEIKIADYNNGKYSQKEFIRILAQSIFALGIKTIEYHQKFIDKGN